MPSITDNIEIFVGATSNVEAHVYVGHEDLGAFAGGGIQWSGWVEGPFCEYAKTLPARVKLRHEGTGLNALLRAIVPDPCFWSPELPFLYQVNLATQGRQDVSDSIQRWIGIKPFRYSGSDLFYADRRHVVRAVDVAAIEGGLTDWEQAVAECRETCAALVVAAVDDRLGELASRRGVMLLTSVAGIDTGSVQQALRQLARWPAVAIAIVRCDVALPADLGRCAPNLLLACQIDGAARTTVPDWASVVVCEAKQLVNGALCASARRLPMMAVGRVARVESVAKGRRQCDGLQSELAPVVDLAGYIVSCQDDASL